MSTDGPTFERVAELIERQCGVRRADLRPASSLEQDLGITGDDAAALMHAYSREFGVDLADFEFLRHFGPEGYLPGLGVYCRLRHGYRIGEQPVTVQMLVDAARAGRWPDYRQRAAERPG